MTIDIRITTLDPVSYGPEDEQIERALRTIGFVREHAAPYGRGSAPVTAEKRHTFIIPNDHEAVVDEEGRATGETRPIVEDPATVIAETAFAPSGAAAVVRPRGKPMPGSGRARRTKEEIAEDDAAQAAEDAVKAAGEETGAIVADKFANERGAISETPEDRVDPDNPDDVAADAADEAAETAQTKAASGGKLTLDDVRNALGVYVQKFGLDAAQADGPKVLKMVCGDGVEKISAIPDDQAIIAKVVAGIEEMTTKNPFKREAVAAKVA